MTANHDAASGGGARAEELAGRLAPTARGTSAHGQTTVDVDPADWVGALTLARDELGFGYFDWITAVDQLAEGFDVVAHLWSLQRREHLLMRTRVPPVDPRLDTATGVFAGASWHERETFEMFGIDFAGHPHLVPLLLPEGFEGNPLRKDFVLAARAAKAWPGAKEPGEPDEPGAASPSRRKTRPPGVPDPEQWGPRPPRAATSLLRSSPPDQPERPERPEDGA